MAGLGEVCSHSAAIAFAVHFNQSSPSPASCTDKLCVWNVPSTAKKIQPSKIKDINWGKEIKNRDYKGI